LGANSTRKVLALAGSKGRDMEIDLAQVRLGLPAKT